MSRMLDIQFDALAKPLTEDISDFADIIEANAPLVAARERGDRSLLIERLVQGIATRAEQAYAAFLLLPKKRGRPTQTVEKRRDGVMMVGDGPNKKKLRFERYLVAMAATDAVAIGKLFRAHYQRTSTETAMEFAARRWSNSTKDAHELVGAINVEISKPLSRSIILRR